VKRAFFFPAVASLLLTACVSSPSTTPRETEIKPAQLGLGTMPAPAIPQGWWTGFGDPQLDGLIAKMLSDNPTLAGALARMRSAQSQLSSARADSYPQLTLDGQEQRERFSKSFIIPPPYGGKTEWMGTLEANLSWNIDFWGRQSAIIAKARSGAKAAALDAAAARLALSGTFAQAYVGLVRAYILSDIAADTLKQREHVLALTNSLVKSGLENVSSQDEAKALIAQAQENLTQANAAREIFVHQIAAFTGQGAEAYATIARPQINLDAVLPQPDSLPADLLARRPDVMAAQERVSAAMSGREAAHAAFYPNINLATFAGFQAIGLASMFTGNALTYGIGPAIHLPIFDAGKLRAEYAGATADLDEAVADYNATVLAAVRQTADALTQIQATQKERGEQNAAIASAMRSLKLAETRYRTGLSNELEVLIAQTILLQAEQQQASIETDAATQRVTLLLALGGDFDPAHPAPKQIRSATQDSAP